MGWFSFHHWCISAYRNPGWYVERDGQRVALLTRPEFADMFWFWWTVEPLSNEPDGRAEVLDPGYWDSDLLSRTKFVSREFGHEAPAFWADSGFENGRLLMRGLYQGTPARWRDRAIIRVLLWLGY